MKKEYTAPNMRVQAMNTAAIMAASANVSFGEQTTETMDAKPGSYSWE